jgi:lambda family phage portal protein
MREQQRPWYRRWLAALAPSRAPRPALAAPPRARRYEAAQSGRLTAGWLSNANGPNTEIGAASQSLRDRSRDLVRNNALAARTMAVLGSALVGDGVRPQPRTGNADLDVLLLDLWGSWGLDADADGRFDPYGLQRLAVTSWLESGESLMRRRWRAPTDPLWLPVQIQLLEADFLADNLWTVGRTPDDERIQYGIELDGIGRRRAYRLYRTHPGETGQSLGAGIETVMVPAREVSHIYLPTRPGQLRGVPWLSPVMLDLRDLDDLEHTEIVRQKMQATVMGVRYTDSLDPVGLSDDVEQNDDGEWVETMRPGMLPKLPSGERIEFFAPQQFGGFRESVQHYQRIVALGAQIPYEVLTGDLTGVNYSSIRAGMIEYRRLLSTMTRQVVVPHVCQPMWRWMVEAAMLAGRLPMMDSETMARAMRPDWHPPRWIAIDREAEAKADILEMQAGLRTLSESAAERGSDWRTVLAQLAEERETAEEMGLSLSGFGSTSPSQAVTMPAGVAEPDAEDAQDDADNQPDDQPDDEAA